MPSVDQAQKTRSLDILQVVTRLNIGGPARLILSLARGLPPAVSMDLAAGRPSDNEGELNDPDIGVHYVPLVRPIRPPTDLRALLTLRKLVVRTKPRIVHTHMAKAGAIGRLASMSTGSRARLVHTYHGHVLHGYFSGHQARAFLEMERVLARRTDVLVAVSPEIRDELVDLGVGRAQQYRVIPVTHDLDPFLAVEGRRGGLRSSIGLRNDEPLAGVVGRLVPIKDHGTLLRALTEIPALHLAVLGDGELRNELEELARQLGLAERVHFVGWHHDMPSAFADLDLVILSSRNEGTPVALIEALASARAVVATNVGGVPNVVQDGETGWLCPPGDAIALRETIKSALRSPDKRASFAVEGRRRVSDKFNIELVLREHLELYQELLTN